MLDIDVIGPRIVATRLEFTLNVDFWSSFDRDILDLNSQQWNEVKFLDESGQNMSNAMNTLPSNQGGLYFFYIKSNIIPGDGHLVYIGRALYTDGQNLKKRCRCYFQKYQNERAKIRRMIRTWGTYLYIKYIPLTDNELIDKLEKELINKILPPFNDEIPDKTIRDAVKAF
jgi:excinuclease UvrABC nuclease subunit